MKITIKNISHDQVRKLNKEIEKIDNLNLGGLSSFVDKTAEWQFTDIKEEARVDVGKLFLNSGFDTAIFN
tara:strand:+ start:571 stop:780 length:210 start_codon:yes stop_codon:yes gene_type:complete